MARPAVVTSDSRRNVEPAFGPRFPDQSEVYRRKLRGLLADTDPGLTEGVYAGLLGPSYETPAEVRMLRGLGADAVGMSTVPEVLVARARGVRVLGISLISNAAAGMRMLAQRLMHLRRCCATNKSKGSRFTLLMPKIRLHTQSDRRRHALQGMLRPEAIGNPTSGILQVGGCPSHGNLQ